MRTVLAFGVALTIAGPLTAQPELEQVLDALEQKYEEGWRQGDAATCASIYSEDADLVDFFGARFEGRAAIQESITQTLQAFGKSTIDIQRTNLHVVSPNVIVSDGGWEVKGSAAEGAPTKGFYTVILQKHGDAWHIVSNRTKVPPSMPGN
jgi:uncharacterized protein (TIGR02246 family)